MGCRPAAKHLLYACLQLCTLVAKHDRVMYSAILWHTVIMS